MDLKDWHILMMNSHILQSMYKVNLKTGEETDFPKRYYYYLNGYGYTFTQKDSEITSFEVCNLKTMEINKDDIGL